MINFSLHLSGNPENIHSVYPDDQFAKDLGGPPSKGSSCFTIARKGMVNYYILDCRLNQNLYMSICVGVNGVLLTQPLTLLKAMQQIFSEYLTNDLIIGYNNQGVPTYKVSSFGSCHREYEQIRTSIEEVIDHCGSKKSDAWLGDNEQIFVPADAVDERIYSLSKKYSEVTVLLNSGVENTAMGQVMKTLREKVTELETKRADLETNIKVLNRQKKQYRWVIMLLGVILIIGLCLYSIFSDLKITQTQLFDTKSELQDSISALSESRLALTATRQELTSTYATLNSTRSQLTSANKHIESLQRDSINASISVQAMDHYNMPFIVTGTSVSSWSTGQLTFSYYGLRSGYAELTYKVFGANFSESVNTKVYIYKGTGTASLRLNRTLDSGKYYTFVILYGNRIIGGGYH